MEELRIELEEVYYKCRKDNWDDEGSSGISMASLNYAKEFTYILSSIEELPKVVPFGSGNLGLEWNIRCCEIIITVLFEMDGTITFSMIAPNVDNYGSMNFSKTNIKFLIDRIKHILKTGE
jgi:hypothetical protein